MTNLTHISHYEDLLDDRERLGVRSLTLVRSIAMPIFLISHWLVASSYFEQIAATVIFFIGMSAIAISLYFLSKHIYTSQIGLVGCFLDICLLSSLPVIWYISVGGVEVPPAYMLKSQLTVMTMIIIALNGLAIRPLYPLAVTLGGMAIHGVLILYILNDPVTVVSSNFVDSVMGPAFSLEFGISSILVILSLGGVVSTMAYIARRAIVQGTRLEVTNSHLGRYFSPGVVAQISGDVGSLTGVGGKMQNVAVMFIDIRNFTTMTEKLSPPEVMEFLSAYHSRMVEEIFKQGGTIDKFMGDAIMVTFGTPEPSEDDAVRAVQTGLSMNQALKEMNNEREIQGREPIHHGIGIHYGPVIAGNIGSEERLEYTVVGDTVNVASRIEDTCRKIGEPFLISEAVKEKLPSNISLRSLSEQYVKGREAPVRIYAVDQES